MPPRNCSAAATKGAPRRCRNAAEPNSTTGITASATGRQVALTPPKAKITKPRVPTKTNSTPR